MQYDIGTQQFWLCVSCLSVCRHQRDYIRTTTDYYKWKCSSWKSACLAYQSFCGDWAYPYPLLGKFAWVCFVCVCVWNSWMKRLMLHCQMSQVVHPSGEINWLPLKQQVVDRSCSIWWESDNWRRQFLLRFSLSHYDLDGTLKMNVSLCRVLFVNKITVGNLYIYNEKQSIILCVFCFSSGAP